MILDPKMTPNLLKIAPKVTPRASQDALGARLPSEAAFGHVCGRFFTPKCSVVVSNFVLFDDALAPVFRFAVGSRFRWKFVLQLSSFSLRAKRRTSEKCNTLHAKTMFFKVRACAAAARTNKKTNEPE